MTKPPKAPPNSDIDGVFEDRRDPVTAAAEAGQSAKELDRAKKQAKGRPPAQD